MADPIAPPPPPQNPPPPVPAAPVAAADAPIIYKGTISHWTACGRYSFFILLELIGIGLLGFGGVYLRHFLGNTGMEEKGSLFGGLALIVISTFLIFYTMLKVRSHLYTVTTRLIERETGILVKKVDALDLGRVKHVDMKQSFVERVVNVGTIEVYSGDANEPELLIEDIPNARPVYEKLRDAVIDLSRRRGVIIE